MQDYKELYDLKEPNYSNQQRRDNIWEEIGDRLNQNGNACKERWTRIRDNHRKALNLRKTKNGQAASKIKPPKHFQELSFLTPYLNDEEERRSNLSPRSVNYNDEIQFETLSDLSNLDNNVSTVSPLSIHSPISSRTARRKSSTAAPHASQGSSAANVLQEYLTRTTQNRNQSDLLLYVFMNWQKQ